jgi:hypothetical protein
MISRSLVHGSRRAEEMREAATTVTSAGVDPLMAEATARRQDLSAAFHESVADDLRPMLDAMLSQMEERHR